MPCISCMTEFLNIFYLMCVWLLCSVSDSYRYSLNPDPTKNMNPDAEDIRKIQCFKN